MRENVGRTDRSVRLAIGTLLVVVGVLGYAGFANLAFFGVGQALAAVVIALLGVVLLATGAVRVCPIYRVLGVDTLGRGDGREDGPTGEKPV